MVVYALHKISSFLEHYYPSPQQNVSTCTHHTHSSTSHHTSTITHTICATQSSKTFVNPTPFGPLPHPLKECTYGICCLFKSEQSFSYLPSPFLTFQLAPLDNRSLAHLWFPCTQNDPHIMSPILLLPPKFSPLFYSSFLRFLASSLPLLFSHCFSFHSPGSPSLSLHVNLFNTRNLLYQINGPICLHKSKFDS